jgi:hypothetical protein
LAEATLTLESSSLLAALIVFLVMAVVVVVAVVGLWRVFTKAGERGWGCLVPVYNTILFLRIARRPAWWLGLFLLPPLAGWIWLALNPLSLGGLGLLAAWAMISNALFLVVLVGLARNFGKGFGFALGLFLLPWIFYPVLGLGRSEFLMHRYDAAWDEYGNAA